jgi:hypothetical protein
VTDPWRTVPHVRVSVTGDPDLAAKARAVVARALLAAGMTDQPPVCHLRLVKLDPVTPGGARRRPPDPPAPPTTSEALKEGSR